MRCFVLLGLGSWLVFFPPATVAQPTTPVSIDELVATYARDHAMEVTLSDGRLTGPAAEWIRHEGADVQFFFLGEEHDVREVPLIAGAIWRELVPFGFTHAAVEAGPWLGDRLDRYARFGDRQALEQFQRATWPRLPNNSVPPISQEDLAFYEVLGKALGARARSDSPLIWGLDHEYRATPLLARLVELAPDSATRREVAPVLAKVRRAEAAGNYDTQAFRQPIERVVQLFRSPGGAEVDHVLYGLNARIRVAPTRRPVNIDLFVRQYEAAKKSGESHPRIMFRFGGYHAARGLMRDFGGSTLANYLAELALTEQTSMLNLTIKNCRGRSPSVFPRPCTWEEEIAVKPFRAAALGPMTLFDLRPLRASLRRARLNALQSYPAGREYWDLVMAYDALIVVTRSERSHLP